MSTARPMTQNEKLFWYVYDQQEEEEEYTSGGSKNNKGGGGQCNFDVEILEFVIETFICMFPTKDCCHDENGVRDLGCICTPCGDSSCCQSCLYHGRHPNDFCYGSSRGVVESKGGEESGPSDEEEDEDDIRDYHRSR